MIRAASPSPELLRANGSHALSRSADTLLSIHSSNTLGLVSIADRKANMMINANSIVLSIVFAFMARRPPGQPLACLIPIAILAIVSLAATIFAILSSRPKVINVSSGHLMTQAVFSTMSYESFRDGMQRLISSDQDIYESVLEGLYANSQVLQRKFRYLSVCYAIFLYGLTLAVASYLVIAFS